MAAVGEKSEALTCAVCGRPPGADAINPGDGGACPECGHPVAFYVFPRAFEKPSRGSAGERLLDERESGCYYHPSNRAVGACEHCGRFVCGLCEVEMDGARLCPRCVEAGEHAGAEEAQREYFHYDTLALHLGFWPLFIVIPVYLVIPMLFTAPIVLYLILRHWRTKLSAAPRWRWRFVVAGFLALAQLAAVMIVIMLYAGAL